MRTLLLAATAACVAGSALAADDVMAARYGNTTITRNADGITNKIHYKADGTLDGTQGDATFTGTWKLDDKGRVCVTTLVSGTLCTPVSAHGVGDTWKAGGYTVTIVPGIQ
jgi:hypothetical protein